MEVIKLVAYRSNTILEMPKPTKKTFKFSRIKMQ